jgi:PKD repeat protein
VFVLPFQPIRINSSNTAPCNKDSSSIGSACEKVCPNTTVTYSVDQISPGTTSPLYWSVNGASSFTINPPFGNSVTVNWGASGTGSVNAVSNDSTTTGCSGEASVCITIIAEPEAKFTTVPAPSGGGIQVCKGQTVYFTNQSTGADYYEWSFSDDASTSPQANTQHTYQTPGTFTVTLVARSACLCADTTKIQVQVLDAESPTLDCVGTICPGETVTYTAANGCAPFTWSVSPNGNVLDGGNANSDSIKIEWFSGPSGTITLGAQPCSGAACPLPAQILVPIISDDAQIEGPERVCPSR